MTSLATTTGQYGTSLVLIKEELEFDDDEEEVVLREDEWMEEVEDEEEVGTSEGMFDFGEDNDPNDDEISVPGRDPLSMDYDEFFEEETEEEGNRSLETGDATVEQVVDDEDDVVVLEDSDVEIVEACDYDYPAEDDQATLVITSVGSLRAESIAGSHNLRPASFLNLEVFRCFLCRKDFRTFDDFLTHRTKTLQHASIPYNAELEKAFCCGVCQKPWNQPRKALACAVYGHDPAKIYESMFIHACPNCPETYLSYHSLAAVGRHWSLEHPDKPLPGFYIKSTGNNDQLPSIKVSLHETSLVTPAMLKDNPSLVLENVAASKQYCPTERMMKIYRCSRCRKNFETRREVEIHQCPVLLKNVALSLTPTVAAQTNRTNICENCKKEFPCSRNFRIHLIRSGCSNDDELPYKCMVCSTRFHSYKSFIGHRRKAHITVPYFAHVELPYACKICQKPALLKKEAVICALFGHDPSSLMKAMFRYKCSLCLSFGFHSTLALKQHMEKEHPQFEIPLHLKFGAMDKPLPSVYITLDQLLSLNRLKEFGSALVTERELDSSLVNYVRVDTTRLSNRVLEEATFNIDTEEMDRKMKMMLPQPPVEVAYLPTHMKDASSKVVFKQLIEESVEKNICLFCNKTFKDLRRHFKVHDFSRFHGDPKHKCVCGKEYHLRNSLHSHWKNNQKCKMKYMSNKELQAKDVDGVQGEVENSGYLLKIPSPLHESFEDPNIKIEYPETNIVNDESTSTQLQDTMPENSGTEKEFDLYSAYAKLDEETAMEDEGLDLANFIHLDVEEVQDNCDPKSLDIAEESGNLVNEEPREMHPHICTICHTGFPSKTMFMNHLSTEHPGRRDTLPYPCSHCGKRFRLKEQRKTHEGIHDPQRFTGEPKYACDQCGVKYHLKTSLESHRKTKHFGYVRPEVRAFKASEISPTHAFLQNRPIGAVKRADHLECNVCQEKFNFMYQLLHHQKRVHGGWGLSQDPMKSDGVTIKLNLQNDMQVNEKKKDIRCNICQRTFIKPCFLQEHLLLHTGEKPHACDQCDRRFRLKKGLNQHKMYKCPQSVSVAINTHKCCVCGRKDFVKPADFIHHRLESHKVPYDQEKEKPYGCGVCQKPFHLQSQAMVCAILGHDPTHLMEAMFKYKCPECPEERLGYHSVASLEKHWVEEHPNKTLPSTFPVNDSNSDETLPSITINEKEAQEIKEKGPLLAYDFPLVVELPFAFETPKPDDLEPPFEFEFADHSDDSSSFSSLPTLSGPFETVTDEDLFLSTVITREQALAAVKALKLSTDPSEVSSKKRRKMSTKKASPKKKSKPTKETEPHSRESVAKDRALGNRRIASILENIRTARARKAAIKAATENATSISDKKT